jgi:hypothetical protein
MTVKFSYVLPRVRWNFHVPLRTFTRCSDVVVVVPDVVEGHGLDGLGDPPGDIRRLVPVSKKTHYN